MSRLCKVEGCGRGHYAKGYCELHYWRIRNNGTIDTAHPKRYYERTGLAKENPVEYRTYRGMVCRCADKNNAYYGGKGINICDRWLGPDGFRHFLDDMGKRPKGYTTTGHSKYSIDRIDYNKGYSPDNCRWATWIEQEGNRRINNKIVGVSKHKQSDGWLSYITIEGKRKVKFFKNKKDAVRQRKQWEASLT